jgi:hypothetical protein
MAPNDVSARPMPSNGFRARMGAARLGRSTDEPSHWLACRASHGESLCPQNYA